MNEKKADHPAIKVHATLPRRRRAGMLFTREPVTLPAGSLTQAQIERLQADPHLVFRPADDAEERRPSKSDEPPGSVEERIAQISEAIPGLGEGGRTKDGKPKIAALEKLLGWKPAAEDIEAATAPQN